LGNHQAGLNRLSQANLVRENATAFAETSKREDYCVNLVGVGINTGLTLRRGIALPVVRPTNSDEVLGENPLVEGVHIVRCVSLNSIDLRSVPFSHPSSIQAASFLGILLFEALLLLPYPFSTQL
jgi:hypothetical protein